MIEYSQANQRIDNDTSVFVKMRKKHGDYSRVSHCAEGFDRNCFRILVDIRIHDRGKNLDRDRTLKRCDPSECILARWPRQRLQITQLISDR